MMAAPFLAFSASIALAMTGRHRAALAAVIVALTLAVALFWLHATDELPISL